MHEELMDKIPSKYMNLWYQENEHEYRLLTITDGVVRLNDLAAYIWALIDGQRTVEMIQNEICRKYPMIEEEKICKDVNMVIIQLLKFEVITLSWKKYGED